MIEECAPAKVNLALHVTGKRTDGLHLLQSLVVFADVGDRLAISIAGQDRLEVAGPFAAGVPTGEGNLIWKAAALMPERPNLHVRLTKNLPPASGIGGGTSDGAAMLRGLARLTGGSLPGVETLAGIGADFPVCLGATAARMAGIGEKLTPIAALPSFPAVLVNPGVEIPTGAVFAALATPANTGLEPCPEVPDRQRWFDYLQNQRNDLEPPAVQIARIVAAVKSALSATEGCQIARMSGSGATVFGLFQTAEQARNAAQRLAADNPGWWVAETVFRGSDDP